MHKYGAYVKARRYLVQPEHIGEQHRQNAAHNALQYVYGQLKYGARKAGGGGVAFSPEQHVRAEVSHRHYHGGKYHRDNAQGNLHGNMSARQFGNGVLDERAAYRALNRFYHQSKGERGGEHDKVGKHCAQTARYRRRCGTEQRRGGEDHGVAQIHIGRADVYADKRKSHDQSRHNARYGDVQNRTPGTCYLFHRQYLRKAVYKISYEKRRVPCGKTRLEKQSCFFPDLTLQAVADSHRIN